MELAGVRAAGDDLVRDGLLGALALIRGHHLGEIRRCREMQGDAGRCREMQGDAGRWSAVRGQHHHARSGLLVLEQAVDLVSGLGLGLGLRLRLG